MVKVLIGKPEDPRCEIELSDEDVEDWKKGANIAEEKLKEALQLSPITTENGHEREDGDLQWDEITFEGEVNGKYWHALIMALHRVRDDEPWTKVVVSRQVQFVIIKVPFVDPVQDEHASTHWAADEEVQSSGSCEPDEQVQFENAPENRSESTGGTGADTTMIGLVVVSEQVPAVPTGKGYEDLKDDVLWSAFLDSPVASGQSSGVAAFCGQRSGREVTKGVAKSILVQTWMVQLMAQ